MPGLISALCKLAHALGLTIPQNNSKLSPIELKAMHKKETTKGLGSTASNSNSSTLDQQRPLITEQTTATEQPTVKRRSNLLNSAAKRLQMLGINGVG